MLYAFYFQRSANSPVTEATAWQRSEQRVVPEANTRGRGHGHIRQDQSSWSYLHWQGSCIRITRVKLALPCTSSHQNSGIVDYGYITSQVSQNTRPHNHKLSRHMASPLQSLPPPTSPPPPSRTSVSQQTWSCSGQQRKRAPASSEQVAA